MTSFQRLEDARSPVSLLRQVDLEDVALAGPEDVDLGDLLVEV